MDDEKTVFKKKIFERMRPPPAGTWLGHLLKRADAREIIDSLSLEEAAYLNKNWLFNARDEQYEPPGSWSTWAFVAGRGAGKTRTGAEWVYDNAMNKGMRVQALVAPTGYDLRNTMIEGASGLKTLFPEINYRSQNKQIIFPNGAVAYGYTAEEPDRLRGPNCYAAWCDELTSWRYDRESWDMLQMTLRLGNIPRAFISTTPKPRPLFIEIIESTRTVVTRCSTKANADNLAPSFLEAIYEKYGGTRLGLQELEAKILKDNEDALWNRDWIDSSRRSVPGEIGRIVVGVDPATTSKDTSDEAGIVIVGTDEREGYVLDDRTVKGTPLEWASAAVSAFHAFNATEIVAEGNNGGDLISTIINGIDSRIPVKIVHASNSKRARAEPVSMLYEQGKIHHLGVFTELEDEMCAWDRKSNFSPNRIDALVWGLTYLMVKMDPRPQIRTL
jgi:phage terminase large subunit-like protein